MIDDIRVPSGTITGPASPTPPHYPTLSDREGQDRRGISAVASSPLICNIRMLITKHIYLLTVVARP